MDRELGALVGDAPSLAALATPAAYRISGLAQGPSVVILGSVHGDEPAGYHAIRELLQQCAEGRLEIARGSLTLAIGNELALERGVRKVERDLNRLFTPEPNLAPSCYEERRAEALKQLLNGADYLLDLHATSRPAPPFAMCESHVLREARAMGFGRIVTGWAELSGGRRSGDTETYINARGGKGFTIETGQRATVESSGAALDAARRFLRHVGMTPYETTADTEPRTYRLFASVRVDEATFKYARAVSSFDRLKAGEVIGEDKAGPHTAPQDCVLIMPSASQFMLAEPEDKGG